MEIEGSIQFRVEKTDQQAPPRLSSPSMTTTTDHSSQKGIFILDDTKNLKYCYYYFNHLTRVLAFGSINL